MHIAALIRHRLAHFLYALVRTQDLALPLPHRLCQEFTAILTNKFLYTVYQAAISV